ncbi:YjgF-like protein [Neoconidiobolus thromboides FSU 785]|nr:YjgF-like protein [Neoconidiobolus thromboides FSU 785]
MLPVKQHLDQHSNGTPIILEDAAQALAHYPHARKHNGLIYISGISSRREDNSYEGVTVQPDGTKFLDIKLQTSAVLKNIEKILKKAHGTLDNVIDLTVFLTDMKYYQEFNQVYNQFFKKETGPSRTTVAVYQLPNPDLLIEIKAIASDPHFNK